MSRKAARPPSSATRSRATSSSAGSRSPSHSGLGNRQIQDLLGYQPIGSAAVDSVMEGAGEPLPPEVGVEMEGRFGTVLAEVRVHRDGRAARAAREMNAHAFVRGLDMVFGAGQFRPGTEKGRRLINHELIHVLQQRDPSRPGPALSPRAGPEINAESGSTHPSRVTPAATGIGLARQPVSWNLNDLSDEELDREFNLVYDRLNEPRSYQGRDLDEERIKEINRVLQSRQQTQNAAPERIRVPGGPEDVPEPSRTLEEVRIDYEAHPDAYRGLEMAYTAELDKRNVYATGVYKSSFYWLAPHFRTGTKQVVYYLAYNPEMRRNEWAIGPRRMKEFIDRETTWRVMAAGAYPMAGDMPKYKAESGKVGARALEGDIGGMFQAWKNSWKAALQDPEFYMEAVPATASLGVRTPKPTGIKPPAGGSGVPPVKPPSAPVARQPTAVPPAAAPKPPAASPVTPPPTAAPKPAPPPAAAPPVAKPKAPPKPKTPKSKPPASGAPTAQPSPKPATKPLRRDPNAQPATYSSTEKTTKKHTVTYPPVEKGKLPKQSLKPGQGTAESMSASQKAREAALQKHGEFPASRRAKTVASEPSGTMSASGYKKIPEVPAKATPREVRARAKEIGHESPAHPHDPKGKSGEYYSSHAEKKTIVDAPDKPVGVSRPMCDDCIGFFRKEAASRRKPQIVSDPQTTRVFDPDGTVTEYWKDGSALRLHPDGSVTAVPVVD